MLFLVFTALIATGSAYNNGVGFRPAMGWNTWCTFERCGKDICNEEEVKQVATAMLSNGMNKLGYNHINLDDCWGAESRDSNGHIQADPNRFPNGIQNLTAWLHARGLQFGLYTSAGDRTCSSGTRPHSIPGSYGHYEDDANTFASWGVDYVKIDWCGGHLTNAQQQHTEFSKYLNATGRHIWLELCRGYGFPPPPYVAQVANSWRVDGDHHDDWGNLAAAIEKVAGHTQMAGPYNWPYSDFLMTGGQGCDAKDPDKPQIHCPGMGDHEYRTEFSIWAITQSPLLVATDIRNMTSIMKEVLLNQEIIVINQENETPAGDRVKTANCDSKVSNACQVWARKMKDGTIAVILYNAGESSHQVDAHFSDLGLSSNARVSVRDLWAHKDVGSATGVYSANVRSHGVEFLRLTPQ